MFLKFTQGSLLQLLIIPKINEHLCSSKLEGLRGPNVSIQGSLSVESSDRNVWSLLKFLLHNCSLILGIIVYRQSEPLICSMGGIFAIIYIYIYIYIYIGIFRAVRRAVNISM